MTTTKHDIVNRISVVTRYPKRHVANVIDQFLEEVGDALVRDGRIELRRFGVFKAVHLDARTTTHPQTGEPIDLPACQHVRFKAGSTLKEKLNS